MKVKPEQLGRLANTLLAAYQTKELIVTQGKEAEIRSKIIEIISQNFAEEEALEEEARKMLSTYVRATKDMDPYKMFLLAKQKLASKKGFIL